MQPVIYLAFVLLPCNITSRRPIMSELYMNHAYVHRDA